MSRGTRVVSTKVGIIFAYGAITLYRRSFQNVRLTSRFVTFGFRCSGTKLTPSTPIGQRLHAWHPTGLGCSPFARRYLENHGCFLLPGGTEMVHFPPFTPPFLCIQKGVAGHNSRRVAPFGYPRLSSQQLTEAYRSLLRPSSPSGTKASTVRP